MFGFFKKEVRKSVPLEWHQQRLRKWEGFIKKCEEYDHVVFKDGSATGFKKSKNRERLSSTGLLIPFEMLTMYYEQ